MSQARDMLNACRDLAKAGKSFSFLSSQVLANNAAKGLDWTKSDILDLEANEDLTPDELRGLVKEFLGSLDSFQQFWQSNGINFEKLTVPIV